GNDSENSGSVPDYFSRVCAFPGAFPDNQACKSQEPTLMAALQQTTVNSVKRSEAQLSARWLADLEASGATRNLKAEDLTQQTSDFLRLLTSVLEKGGSPSINAAEWDEVRQFLERLSHQRALAGQDSQQT